jgi:hypothetical protein
MMSCLSKSSCLIKNSNHTPAGRMPGAAASTTWRATQSVDWVAASRGVVASQDNGHAQTIRMRAGAKIDSVNFSVGKIESDTVKISCVPDDIPLASITNATSCDTTKVMLMI